MTVRGEVLDFLGPAEENGAGPACEAGPSAGNDEEAACEAASPVEQIHTHQQVSKG